MTNTHVLTGSKVLMVFLVFFGVMLVVNLVLAWKAVSTFPGLEVSSSYADSQDFDVRRRAQEALAWHASVEVESGVLTLHLNTPDGAVARPAQLDALLTRPTNRREDQVLDLVLVDGDYQAPVVMGEGLWRLRLTGIAQDGTAYRHNLTFRQN